MKLIRTLAVSTAAAVLVLAPTAANAESKVHVDPTGDVAMFSDEGLSEAEDPTPVPAPGRVEGDIKSIRVTHLAATVRVALAYKELNRSGFARFVGLRILSDKGVRQVEADAFRGRWYGSHTFTNGNDDELRCAGLTHKFDYVKNTVLIVVPRTCLKNPRWVRVAGMSGSMDTDFTMYFDDARSSNYFGESYVYGPKVRRG